MEIADTYPNRLIVGQAKAFLIVMLVTWFAANIALAYSFLAGNIVGSQGFLLVLGVQLLFLAVFVLGNLFLLFGIFWWEKLELKKKK